MGYSLVSKTSVCEELLTEIPYLRDNPAELRQWTVRYTSLPRSESEKSPRSLETKVVKEDDSDVEVRDSSDAIVRPDYNAMWECFATNTDLFDMLSDIDCD